MCRGKVIPAGQNQSVQNSSITPAAAPLLWAAIGSVLVDDFLLSSACLLRDTPWISKSFWRPPKRLHFLLKPHLDVPVLFACCWYLFHSPACQKPDSPHSPGPLPGPAKSHLHLPMTNRQSHSWYFNRIHFSSSREISGAHMTSFAGKTCGFQLFPEKEKVRKLPWVLWTQSCLLPCLQQSSLGRRHRRCS